MKFYFINVNSFRKIKEIHENHRYLSQKHERVNFPLLIFRIMASLNKKKINRQNKKQ